MTTITTNTTSFTTTTTPNNLTNANILVVYADGRQEEQDFLKFLEEMASKTSTTNRSKPRIEDFLRDDDYFFYRQQPVGSEIFPVSVIIFTFVCIVSIIICMIYSCCTRKSRRHPIYSLLNHYLFFNILLSFDVCIQVLTSPLIRGTTFYMHKTSGNCTLNQFIQMFVEGSQSVQLLLIWLIILAERDLFPRFQFLYASYELDCALHDGTTLRADIAKLREKTFSNFVIRNSRAFILGVTYSFGFVLSVYFSESSVYPYKSMSLCIMYSSGGFSYLFRIFFFFMFYFPLLYYLVAATTCFSSHFGGSRDSIASSLTDRDRDRLTLVKNVTLLRCVIQFLMEVHSSAYLVLSSTVYELLRLFGFFAIFTTTLLFFKYEGFYPKIRTRLFRLIGRSSPQDSNQRAGFIFRSEQNRDESSSAIDYTNLVENENAEN